MMTFLYLSACYLFCVTRIMNLNTREIICQFPKAGFWIHIDLMQIWIPHFFLSADPGLFCEFNNLIVTFLGIFLK